MICRPATIMVVATKTIMAPMIGAGSRAMTALAFGMKARRIISAPMLSPMKRLVAPVAIDSPTLLDEALWPRVPRRPDRTVVMPSTVPPRLTS